MEDGKESNTEKPAYHVPLKRGPNLCGLSSDAFSCNMQLDAIVHEKPGTKLTQQGVPCTVKLEVREPRERGALACGALGDHFLT